MSSSYIYHTSQIVELEKHTFDTVGVSSITIMENAGRAVTSVLLNEFSLDTRSGKACVFCGPGNNGGDGFIVGRTLLSCGAKVSLFSTKSVQELGADAALAAQSFLKAGGEIISIKSNLERVEKEIQASNVIVDALLGTGFKGDLRGAITKLIKLINGSKCPVVSIDLPSGVEADSSKTSGVAISADLTVALHSLKRCHIMLPVALSSGSVFVVNIGLVKNPVIETNLELLSKDTFSNIDFSLPLNSHKGTKGHLLVIGGGEGKFGAIKLSGNAAIRCGAGLVTLLTPKKDFNKLEIQLDELMCDGILKDDLDIDKFYLKFIKGKSAVIIGPGLGVGSLEAKIVEIVMCICDKNKVPLIIDADALNLIAELKFLREKVPKGSVLTPHPGEMSRMLGISSNEVQSTRDESIRKLSDEINSTVILKGARTLICDAQADKVFVNPSITPVLATAGSGDLLAGIIGGLICRGLDEVTASKLGVFLHGKAGESLQASHKESFGVTAKDIIEEVNKVLNSGSYKQSDSIGLVQKAICNRLETHN